jgi:hypothetical protein
VKKGETFRAYASITANDKTYFVTEYSYAKGLKNGIESSLLEIVTIPVPVPEPPQPPIVPPVIPVDPLKPTEGETAKSWLQRVFEWILEMLSKFTFKK